MAIDRDNQKGRMKPLSNYLKAIKPVSNQPAEEAASVFIALQARGKSVTIRERPKG